MHKGMVLGKFMPLHNGHIRLIEFARKNCDHLVVLLCSTCNEPIAGNIRFKWLNEYFNASTNLNIVHFNYDEDELPNTSESSKDVSYLWAQVLKDRFPDIDCFISSEPYGEYVAHYMGISSVIFDIERQQISISGTEIRLNPYLFWDYLPDVVKQFYYRKVCVVGTESVGKSTLVQRLAWHFKSDYVSEAGRDVVAITEKCTFDDLRKIATTHANRILEKDKKLCKLLFVDTDVFITKSYANFLFNRELIVDDWILKANRFHLYLYLENDAPFVQDGTRLSLEERNKLDIFHKNELDFQQILYCSISGSWEERFQMALSIVKREFEIT